MLKYLILAFFIIIISFSSVLATTLLNAPFFLILILICHTFNSKNSLKLNLCFCLIFILFKNLFLHIIYKIEPSLINDFNMKMLLGVDYIYIVSSFVYFLFVRVVKINGVEVLILIVIFLYSILGVVNSSALSVVMYSRFYLIPFVAFVFGRHLYIEDNIKLIISILFLYLILIIIELLIPNYLNLIDAESFKYIKYFSDFERAHAMDFLYRMGTTINGERVIRLLGPQMHPISVGYTILSFAVIFSIFNKKIHWIFLPLALVLGFYSSKGVLAALLIFYISVFLYDAKLKKTMFSLLVVYFVLLIYLSSIPGVSSGYEHFIGLIGAIISFPSHPFGLGLGSGGTMSVLKGPLYGGESGFGTVLSHFGVIAVLAYAYIFNKIRKSSELIFFYYACYLYIGLVLINSFLQEEALSPIGVFIPFILLGISLNVKSQDYLKN